MNGVLKTKLIKGATGDWEMVIGMEVHAQVLSRVEALFGSFGRIRRRAERSCFASSMPPMPGMLPVINELCVKQALRTGLGLKAQINPFGFRPEKLFLS